jgi:hypothetical protein
VEVSQFYNSYKENSESVLKRQPVSAKSKGKQRATDAEIWSTMGRELPLRFQGQKGVDMALRLIEETSTSPGSSTKVKERLATVELKVCSIRPDNILPCLTCSVCSWKVLTNSLGQHWNARTRLRMNWIDVSQTLTLQSLQRMSCHRYPATPSHPDYYVYPTAQTRNQLRLTPRMSYARCRELICNVRLPKSETPHDELRGRLSGPASRQISRGS